MWEKLEPILRGMFDDADFIRGMKALLPTEDNKEEMLNAIDKGWVKNDEDAILYAMAIYHSTRPGKGESDDGRN